MRKKNTLKRKNYKRKTIRRRKNKRRINKRYIGGGTCPSCREQSGSYLVKARGGAVCSLCRLSDDDAEPPELKDPILVLPCGHMICEECNSNLLPGGGGPPFLDPVASPDAIPPEGGLSTGQN